MELLFVLRSESAHTAHFVVPYIKGMQQQIGLPLIQSHTIVNFIVWKHNIRVPSANIHSLEHGVWLTTLINLQNRVHHLTRVFCRFCLIV